jgi:hypothetical protein
MLVDSRSMIALDSACREYLKDNEEVQKTLCETEHRRETVCEIVTLCGCTFDEHAVDESNGHFPVAVQP